MQLEVLVCLARQKKKTYVHMHGLESKYRSTTEPKIILQYLQTLWLAEVCAPAD